MTDQKQELMPATYKEEWIVSVGRDKFVLDEKQIAVLKNADIAGRRGIVWFDGFGISIPHIQSIFRSYKGPKIDEKKPIRWEYKGNKAIPIYED